MPDIVHKLMPRLQPDLRDSSRSSKPEG